MEISTFLVVLALVAAVLGVVVWILRLRNELRRRRILVNEEKFAQKSGDTPKPSPRVMQVAGRDNHYVDNRSTKQ